jgi:PAS domain S-box-containing protein
VQLCNQWAEELLGLHSIEVTGRVFLDLEIGLPAERVAGVIRRCVDQGAIQEVQLDAPNRQGHDIGRRIICSPLAVSGEVNGVMLVMEEITATEDRPLRA